MHCVLGDVRMFGKQGMWLLPLLLPLTCPVIMGSSSSLLPKNSPGKSNL